MPLGFSDAATMSMQKEALRRVREMQRKAQQSLEGSEPVSPAPNTNDKRFQQQNTPPNSPSNSYQRQKNSPPTLQNRQNSSPQDIFSKLLGGKSADLGSLGDAVQNAISSASQPAAQLLDSFGIDGEKLIILMVMWAVFNEHKDNKLLLMALGYLLL